MWNSETPINNNKTDSKLIVEAFSIFIKIAKRNGLCNLCNKINCDF